jgi:hypothetical protein
VRHSSTTATRFLKSFDREFAPVGSFASENRSGRTVCPKTSLQLDSSQLCWEQGPVDITQIRPAMVLYESPFDHTPVAIDWFPYAALQARVWLRESPHG